MSEEVITQARPPSFHEDLRGELPELLVLNLNGAKFEILRELFFTLPECILICLSLGTTPQPQVDETGQVYFPDDSDDGLINIDFNPKCFEYVLMKISDVGRGLTPVNVMQYKMRPTSASGNNEEMLYDVEQADEIPWLPNNPNAIPQVLEQRPSFIVLKEDLEYYLFNQTNIDDHELNDLKNEVGNMFANAQENMHIFRGLRNSQELNSPEYFLMQMLVQAGMRPEQLWDYRERYENTSRVSSMQLTQVKLPPSEMIESIHALHKLLLFWRKPAKKCWWDRKEMLISGKPLVVHCRRVWTLELDILGLKN